MRRCIFCGSETFVLLTTVECTNPSCQHYRAPSESTNGRTTGSRPAVSSNAPGNRRNRRVSMRARS